MITYAINTWGVDAGRVFVTGTSSGAMMTNVMAGSVSFVHLDQKVALLIAPFSSIPIFSKLPPPTPACLSLVSLAAATGIALVPTVKFPRPRSNG